MDFLSTKRQCELYNNKHFRKYDIPIFPIFINVEYFGWLYVLKNVQLTDTFLYLGIHTQKLWVSEN
jgi:hypothetical protein